MVARAKQVTAVPSAEGLIQTVADFEAVAAQIKQLESVLKTSRQTALALISTKTAEATAALSEAERIADLAGVEFAFEFGDVSQQYDPTRGGWTNSSYNC